MRNQRGALLVEAMLAVAVISIVLLVLVSTSSHSLKSLTQMRAKRDATGYLHAELRRLQALAKLGRLEGTPQVPVPVGYQMLTPTVLPVEETVTYPDAMMGSVGASFNRRRMTVRRLVTIEVENSGAADELKTVTVRLRDGKTPESFSPVSMSTKIRLPDPASLDLRQDSGIASLTVQVESADRQPIAASCGPRVALSGPANPSLDLPPPGIGVFPMLPAGQPYTVAFTAASCMPGYWPETFSNIVPSSGGQNRPAALNPARLERVAMAQASIRVIDDKGTPVRDATVRIAAPGMPEVPGYTGGSVLSGQTNPSGEYDVELPIPYKERTRYDNWRVERVTKADFFADTSGLRFAIDTTARARVGPITIYPVRRATIDVTVREQTTGLPVEDALVKAFDNGDETPCGGAGVETCLALQGASARTDASGSARLTVPVNWAANPQAQDRTVQVAVMLVGFKRQVRRVAVTADRRSTLDLNLTPAAFWLMMEPATTSSTPAELWGVSIMRPVARAIYDGHGGPVEIAESAVPGAQSVSKAWSWSVQPASLGTVTPASSNYPAVFFTSANPGSGKLIAYSTFTFSYPGGEYGPAVGPLTYTASGEVDVLVHAAGPPRLEVAIWGNARVARNSLSEYLAITRYGNQPVPQDLTYEWSLEDSDASEGIGAQGGLKDPRDRRSVWLSAEGQEGTIYRIKVVVRSASINQMAEKVFPVEVGFAAFVASLPCSAARVELRPYEERPIQAAVTGGSGSYAYTWTLVDHQSRQSLGTTSRWGSLIGPAGLSSTNFQAGLPGSVDVRLVARDTVTNTNAEPVSCEMYVKPSGGSF